MCDQLYRHIAKLLTSPLLEPGYCLRYQWCPNGGMDLVAATICGLPMYTTGLLPEWADENEQEPFILVVENTVYVHLFTARRVRVEGTCQQKAVEFVMKEIAHV